MEGGAGSACDVCGSNAVDAMNKLYIGHLESKLPHCENMADVINAIGVECKDKNT